MPSSSPSGGFESQAGAPGSGTGAPSSDLASCEVLAIGTELLLGQVVDTNSAWIGERLAAAGIACYVQTKVGDNEARIVKALEAALSRSQAVICCGGLGPTPDDITREAIARLMHVPLERDHELEDALRERFAGREVPASNYRQADVPRGCSTITNTTGTAPGLICPVGDKVIYAVPGVPAEMREMVERAVIADLQRRSGWQGAIVSRYLRVWGIPESKVAEMVAPRVRALEEKGNPTIAFLASAVEGVRVRVTARASAAEAAKAGCEPVEAARRLLDAEEANLRALLGDAVGGVDDEGLEASIGGLLVEQGLSLAVAESLTGGRVAARLVGVPGASRWLVGGLVAYAEEVKRDVLGVTAELVVSDQAAREMAAGVARFLRSDIGLSLTGVAGPTSQDDKPVGTVFVGLAYPRPGGQETAQATEAVQLSLRGNRNFVQERAATLAMDLLRRKLLGFREPGLPGVQPNQ
ncbi:MAG: competence/damage-inducible protein A [Acidimicrobiales bacterium]